MTRWGPYVYQRLDDIRSGKGRNEWEGEWPSPVAAQSAWNWAVDVLPEGAPAPSVVPGEDGCILFIWHRGGWTIEIEVDGEGVAHLWMWDRSELGGDEYSGPLEEGRDRLRAVLGELAQI